MKIKVRYRAHYRFAEPVTFSLHEFRLFPRSERHVRVLSSAFATNPGATISYRRDLFDNDIASCFYPEAATELTVSFDLELHIEAKNAFDFFIDAHAREYPFVYQPAEARLLSPYLYETQHIGLPFWTAPPRGTATLEMLMSLNESIHNNIAYARRDEGDSLAPAELLRLGAGSCRDFAVLLAQVLRGLGIASRVASGYLCEFGDGTRVAEGALHAWTEAYIPGAGWLGMDPTNGTLCDHHHLTAAVGLEPEDITPVLGDYYSVAHTPSHMETSLQIVPLPDA